jgi:hypothetical protein
MLGARIYQDPPPPKWATRMAQAGLNAGLSEEQAGPFLVYMFLLERQATVKKFTDAEARQIASDFRAAWDGYTGNDPMGPMLAAMAVFRVDERDFNVRAANYAVQLGYVPQ